jgi:hypothetical protein
MTEKQIKKFKVQLIKFKNAKIIYRTPGNQIWCILSNGFKKCVVKKIVDQMELHNFLKDKNVVSYIDSQKIKKNSKLNFLVSGLDIVLEKKKH